MQSFDYFWKILWKMEHLLQKSKCHIFHNIFKYMIFQKRQKALVWSKRLSLIWVQTASKDKESCH